MLAPFQSNESFPMRLIHIFDLTLPYKNKKGDGLKYPRISCSFIPNNYIFRFCKKKKEWNI